MSKNYFIRPDEEYVRNINPIKHYIESASFYLHKETNIPISECRLYIENKLNNKDLNLFKDPVIKYIEQNDFGDHEDKTSTLSNYIGETLQNSDILAPSFTTYVNSKVKKSLLGDFLQINVKKRSIAKKEGFAAKAVGNMVLYTIKNNAQGVAKIFNNSMSGGFASNGTSLYNPTAHSTLTSITRTITSIGNAINEKLIAGNRHYLSYGIVLSNIIYIIKMTDMSAFSETMARYNLYVPNTADVLECITYSSDLYWKNPKLLAKIHSFVDKLDPLEKAAFIYLGDLYHIRKHNSDFVHTLITQLSSKVTDPTIDSLAVVKGMDEASLNLACQICSVEIKGMGKDYVLMDKKGVLNTLAATSLNIVKVIENYGDFITTMLASNTIPNSIAYIRNMIRRTVVVSDTDSTMFSIDEYIHWYFKKMIFSPEAFAVASTVMHITTQAIGNGLRMFSTNLNVSKENLNVLGMKPEYSFEVFATSSVSKHYYATKIVQEGNVFDEPEIEIKGVHLISSAIPKEITNLGLAKMTQILEDISNNKTISIKEYLTDLANLERTIYNSIIAGEIKYLRSSSIKDKEAYSGPIHQSPYVHYLLWEEVFKEKYGEIEPIPFPVIKLPLTLDNKTLLASWIDTMADRDIAERMKCWVVKYNKERLGTVFINTTYARSYKIPIELVPAINSKKIILELTKSFRMIAETLGYYLKTDALSMELGY